MKAKSLPSILKQIGHTDWLIAVALTSVLRTVRDLACIITIANVADVALQGGDMMQALIWVIVAEFGGIPILAADSYCCEKYRVESERTLTLKISQRIQTASMAWLDGRTVGDLVSTATSDVDKLLQWQFFVIPNCIRTGAYLIGGLWYCCTQSIALSMCVFPVVLLVVPLINKISAPLKKNADLQRKAAARSLSKVQEILVDPEFVKSFSLEESMDRRVTATLRERKAAEDEAAGIWARSQAFGRLGSYLPSIFCAVVGFLFLASGAITVGFLFSFVQMVSQRFGYVITQISEMIAKSHQAGASAKRILELLDAPEERASDGKETRPPSESIYTLNRVSFAYPTAPETPVLKELTMEIKKGEHIALVGSSGCGKSTLLKLLLGVYPPSSGELFYRSRNIQEIDPKQLWEELSPVPQSSFLFPLSIRDNLHVFETPCHDDEILSALENAGIGEYYRSLPEGLDTILDQQGSSLSGGQRQRMTIARVYLKDAPVILLDEPTSAMDTVTQAAFQKSFERVSEGKTTIMVSHRWPVIENADRIYVMEQGRIVENGTHHELMKLDGVYRKLHQEQEHLA